MSATVALDRQTSERWQLRETGVWMFLGTVVMLFAAFTSAYVVRKSASDWVPVQLPSLLWMNTGILVLSSVALEFGRRPEISRRAAAAFVGATCGLALAFFAGQWEAWQILSRAGVFLKTNPASSFFYILTGLHGIHLIVAFGFVAYLFARTAKPDNQEGWPQLAGLTAIVWHFLTFVWVYLLLMLRLA